jgi:aryl-alcohol dehydrogenase-like predicted oxidoreductase
VLYHLEERAIEHDVIPWCAAHEVPLVAYSPFGSGRFPSETSPGGRALRVVAERIGATTRQVALAFLGRWPNSYVIPKASRSAHAEDNAGANGLALSEDDIALLGSAFPLGPPSSLPVI